MALGLLFGGGFLWLATRQASWAGFIQTIETLDPAMLIWGAALYGLYLVTRAARWSLLLAERCSDRPFSLLFRAVTWGTAANAVVPHSGELLRTLVTRRRLRTSASSILGSIAAERLYDFATVVVLTILPLLFFKEAPGILSVALGTIAVMGGSVLAALAMIGSRNRWVVSLLDLITKALPRRFAGTARWQVDELSAGIRAAFLNSRLAEIGALSLIQWLLVTACIYTSIAAFNLDLSLWTPFVILPLTIAGLTLPTAPAYLGTIQVCFLAGLAPFDVSTEAAIAVSVAYISIVTLPVMFAGAAWFLLHLLVHRRVL
jgi:uncharacterized protein (TIRG00374 family)